MKGYSLNSNSQCSFEEALRRIETIYGTFVLDGVGHLQQITVVLRFADIQGGFQNGGVYCTTGYTNVIGAPGGPDVDGIPVWLPLLGRYGCWDGDCEQSLFLYPDDISWHEIESNLLYYVSFRGCEVLPFAEIWRHKNAHNCFDFVPDDLVGLVEEIMHLPRGYNALLMEQFIGHYEPILLRHTFCPELSWAYPALIIAYKSMAQQCLTEGEAPTHSTATTVIGWYERCIPIIDQFRACDMAPDPYFADVFLLLSLWYSDIGMFEEAFEYASKWRAYDPSVVEAYAELRNMLLMKRELGIGQFEIAIGKSGLHE